MKNYIMLLFIVLFSWSYAGEGEKIFKNDILIFAEMKTKNILDENISEIKLIKDKMEESKLSTIIDINSIAVKNIEIGLFNSGYIIIKPMSFKEYQASKIYKNPIFSEEVIEGVTVNTLNESLIAYFWELGNLYLSDNKNLLVNAINGKKDKRNILMKNNKNYQNLNSYEKSYTAKIFINYRIETESYTAENGIVFFTEKNIRRVNSPSVLMPLNYRTVDYSRFVEEKPDKVYLGRETDKIFKRIFSDMPYFKYRKDKELEEYFAKKYKHFLIGEKEKRFYIVMYAEDFASDEGLNKIVKYFEKNIMYWKKMNVQRNEGYGYFIEIPVIGKKYYWGLRDKYAIFTNDAEYMKNVFGAKYNDINYLRIETSIIYEYDYAKKNARNVFYRENEVEETISVANTK